MKEDTILWSLWELQAAVIQVVFHPLGLSVKPFRILQITAWVAGDS